ncbi:MAG: hypothetical protein H6606_03425 [Flavobacteriales bacterium]|nr:hypothetical protein [Flavobacteriales bacterium]
MGRLKYFILGAILTAAFLMNPDREEFYDRAIKDDAGIELGLFKQAQYNIIEQLYTYENYYVCGVLRSKKSGNIVYTGLFGKIYLIDR